MTRRRTGTSIPEMAICLALVTVILGILGTVKNSVMKQYHLAEETNDAVRSCLVAAEYIRRDVDRMLLSDSGRDIALLDGGRGLGLRIPERLEADLWQTRYVPVFYQLIPDPHHRGMYQLARTCADTTLRVASCNLADLEFRFIRAGQMGARKPYLQVVITALGCGGESFYRSVLLIALNPMHPPPPILVRGRAA
jgi:hypothetical protein